jgi:hypothetical protein
MNATASSLPPLRITRRGRAVLTAVVSIPLAVGALFVALNGGMATAVADFGHETGQFQQVTVQSGQSLWQLAEALAPSADPRDVIADIVHLNQLPDADVHAGQTLAIPAGYSH